MHETTKKFSDELAVRIASILESKQVKEVVESTKAAEDTGTFEVVISTADVDRYGEVVVQEGMDTSLYMKNPVVLFGHDYYSLPVGICDSIELRDGKHIAKGRFAPASANPFAQQVRALYDLGILRATSVGFIVKEIEGKIITKSELLEFSFVPVPANPHALTLSQIQERGIDREMLAVKGLSMIEVKDAEAAPAATDAPAAEAQPEAEKPAEETPAAPATEEKEKGAVADEISAQEAWDQKWKNLSPFFDVVDSFLNVYLDENTGVDQFGPLLAETAGLLNELAGGAAATEGEKGVKSAITEKSGTEIVAAIKTAIKKYGDAGGISGMSEQKEQGNGPAAKKVEGAQSTIVDEFDARQVLRSLHTATGDALKRLAERQRERSATR